MIKKLALLVIILLMATPVVAQAQQPKDTLVIATSTGFQPFTFLNAEGKPAGMFVDIWRLWSQKTGKQIEFISSNWNTSLENLKNQKADIHSGLLYPRPEHLDWISGSQPFYEVGVTLFYPVKQGKLSDIKELSGQTVAANRGSHPELFLKENYPSIRVLACDTREELAKVSQEGKSKAFIIILPVGKSVIDRLGLSGEFETYEKILYREKFHAGVLKENTELLALVDKGFNAMSHQELAEIEARWMPDPAKQYYKTSNIIRLLPAEETWLKNHKTIRVGISPVMPPLKFFEKGVIKGIEPDYINLLSEYTGINFQLVVCDFKDMDTKAKSGETDMFLSVYVPERFTHMMLTKPFMDFDQIIVTRSDAPFMSGIGSLKGKKVAVLRGVKLHEKILAPYPEIEAVRVDTMEQMFKSVSESKADALISKIYFAAYVMHQYPNLKIAGIANIPHDPYYYAVRKDYPELVSILNKAIQSIPNDRVNAIVQKWFSVRVEYRPNWSEILKWAFAIGGAFTLILGLSLFWNRRLAREIDKRKKVQEVLQATGKMSKVGGWEINVETMEQVWTEETYRIHEVDFDYKPTAEKGIDFYAPEAKPVIRQAVQRAIDHGEPFDVELPFITAKDTRLWVHAIGQAIQKEGKTVKVGGTFQDITERKQADKSLLESEERYRGLFNHMSSGVAVYEAIDNGGDFIFKDFNPAAEKIEKIGREDIIGKRVSEAFPGVKAFGVFEVFQRVWQTGKPEYFPQNIYRDERDPGSWRESWVFKLPTGEIVAIYNDITERKQADQALQESEQRYRVLFEGSTHGILMTDSGTERFVDANLSICRMLGYSKAEFLQLGIADIHPKESMDHLMSEIKSQERGEPQISRSIPCLRKDGTVFYADIFGANTIVHGRRCNVGFFMDITERKLAEEKIKASLKEKEALLSEVHHRVKNNMQVIISLLKLQAEKIEDKKYADMLKESQNRILSMALVHEKFYMSKDFSNIDFGEYVKSFVNILFVSHGLDTNKIKLNIEIKDVSFDIENAIPCGLLINELVSNSLKHAFPQQREGNISIILQSTNEDELELTVSDDGVGIPEDLDVRDTESMGLHLVKVLSEQTLEGKMELNRTEGTQFHFILKRSKYKPRI